MQTTSGCPDGRSRDLHCYQEVTIMSDRGRLSFFLIADGREGTPMQGWRDRISEEEVDAIVAYLLAK